jgi:HPt (histidine-containing phosphotransfer) domain-containing protein
VTGGRVDDRYRLDVVARNVPEVVKFAGGWLVDRVMAGWDVTVLISAADDDLRPLEILGVATHDLETVLQEWTDRPHPQTVAVAAELFASDERVRRGVLGALDHGGTQVTLWGEHWPEELDSTIASVHHRLSGAARAFKAQALAAAADPDAGTVGDTESFRCGVAALSSVAADLIPAS